MLIEKERKTKTISYISCLVLIAYVVSLHKSRKNFLKRIYILERNGRQMETLPKQENQEMEGTILTSTCRQ